jgi:hypothetical protein
MCALLPRRGRQQQDCRGRHTGIMGGVKQSIGVSLVALKTQQTPPRLPSPFLHPPALHTHGHRERRGARKRRPQATITTKHNRPRVRCTGYGVGFLFPSLSRFRGPGRDASSSQRTRWIPPVAADIFFWRGANFLRKGVGWGSQLLSSTDALASVGSECRSSLPFLGSPSSPRHDLRLIRR